MQILAILGILSVFGLIGWYMYDTYKHSEKTKISH